MIIHTLYILFCIFLCVGLKGQAKHDCQLFWFFFYIIDIAFPCKEQENKWKKANPDQILGISLPFCIPSTWITWGRKEEVNTKRLLSSTLTFLPLVVIPGTVTCAEDNKFKVPGSAYCSFSPRFDFSVLSSKKFEPGSHLGGTAAPYIKLHPLWSHGIDLT